MHYCASDSNVRVRKTAIAGVEHFEAGRRGVPVHLRTSITAQSFSLLPFCLLGRAQSPVVGTLSDSEVDPPDDPREFWWRPRVSMGYRLLEIEVALL